MKYFSIDIETTGLDPIQDQILEIGIVEDDLNNQLPLTKLRRFHCYIKHDRIIGNPFAIAMNHLIIERIAKPIAGYKYCNRDDIVSEMHDFLGGGEKYVFAGKNFGAFDLQFLKRLPGWSWVRCGLRFLDPAMKYLNVGDTEIPSLQTCCLRAGIDSVVTHTAVEDALLVVQLLRIGMKR